MKNKALLAAIIAFSFFFASCENEEVVKDEILEISGVTINTINAELAVGDTITITATILPFSVNPENVEWQKGFEDYVFWKSDNPDVATVSQNGLVTAIGKGSCTISFICGTYAAKCSIIVRDFNIGRIYGQWLSEDSLNYYFHYNGTGIIEGEAFNWSFDGMRLTVKTSNSETTMIVVSASTGEFVYYDKSDPDKKRKKMEMVAKPISIDDLKQGLTKIAGKDGTTYDAIDLGLPGGVLWCTCNLTAQSPEQSGCFYAWGETETKEDFYLENYKWYDTISLELTKYINTDDNQSITLEREDDAANVIMGGDWRIPTSDELQSLCNNCFAVWSKLGDTVGLLFTSKKTGYEGNAIFIPLSGLKENYYEELDPEKKKIGIYWTASLSKNDNFGAYYLQLDYMSDLDLLQTYYNNSTSKRYTGACIRPVVNK